MFKLIWDFLFYVVIGIPVSVLLVYFLAEFTHSMFLGPTWLWFLVFLIGGISSAYVKYKENLRKIREESNA